MRAAEAFQLGWHRCTGHWAGWLTSLAHDLGAARTGLGLDSSPDPRLLRRIAAAMLQGADSPPPFPDDRKAGTSTGRRKLGPGPTQTRTPER